MTSLSLFGYRVDGVVANRIFPGDGRRSVATAMGRGPAAILDEVTRSFAPVADLALDLPGA